LRTARSNGVRGHEDWCHCKHGGIDIIGAKRDAAVGDFLVAAQVKHHRAGQKTGVDKVRDLLSFKNTVFRFGLLVTNTGFTDDAKWSAVQATIDGSPNFATSRISENGLRKISR
jgi:hypothetical protein